MTHTTRCRSRTHTRPPLRPHATQLSPLGALFLLVALLAAPAVIAVLIVTAAAAPPPAAAAAAAVVVAVRGLGLAARARLHLIKHRAGLIQRQLRCGHGHMCGKAREGEAMLARQNCWCAAMRATLAVPVMIQWPARVVAPKSGPVHSC